MTFRNSDIADFQLGIKHLGAYIDLSRSDVKIAFRTAVSVECKQSLLSQVR